MESRRIVAATALAVAALGLIGAGAGAQFTDSTTTPARITAGTLDVALSSPAAGSSVAATGKDLTLGAWGPTNATFTTGAQPVRFTNTGTVAAHRVVITAAPTPASTRAGAAFAEQICVRLRAAGATVYDGPLRSLTPTARRVTIPARGSLTATVEFYAGTGACPALTAGAMGGAITPALTATFSD